jgi:hypothetical protein
LYFPFLALKIKIKLCFYIELGVGIGGIGDGRDFPPNVPTLLVKLVISPTSFQLGLFRLLPSPVADNWLVREALQLVSFQTDEKTSFHVASS